MNPIRLFPAAFALAISTAISPLSAQPRFKCLVYYAAGGFNTAGIATGNTALLALGAAHGFAVDTTRNAEIFTKANLDKYQVLVMNNTSQLGNLLNAQQKSALMEFLGTHGHVGIHMSAETFGGFPEYSAYMAAESNTWGVGKSKITLDTAVGAGKSWITRGMPAEATLTDYWYLFRSNPRNVPGVRILYTLDESTCPNCQKMPDGDHPVAWTREFPAGGRMFYMDMGHMYNSFDPPFIQDLLLRAIQWAAKDSDSYATEIRGIAASESGLKVIANGSGFTVEIKTGISDARHRILVSTLDGKRVDSREGTGNRNYRFEGLPWGSVYLVTRETAEGRKSRLVTLE